MSFVKSEAEVLLLGLTRRLHRFMFMCMGGRHFYKNTAGSVVGISDLMPAAHHRSISALRKFSHIFFGRSCAFTLLRQL